MKWLVAYETILVIDQTTVEVCLESKNKIHEKVLLKRSFK